VRPAAELNTLIELPQPATTNPCTAITPPITYSLYLPLQRATFASVAPLLLDKVVVAVPLNIGFATIQRNTTEVPGALVANLVLISVIPGIDQWVCNGLHLLMAGDVDGAISIVVIIR
jgi:hypothetical protein